MTIQATCIGCEKVYHLADVHAGRLLKCKSCGGAFTVPKAQKPSRLKWWLIGGGVGVLAAFMLLCGGGIVIAVWMSPLVQPSPTPARFDQIRAGMSEKEVVALMGPAHPNVTLHPMLTNIPLIGIDPARTKELTWRGNASTTYRVILLDGYVMGALGTDGQNIYAPLLDDPNFAGGGGNTPATTPASTAVAKPAARQALEDKFRQLRPGMTTAQVTAILGQPDKFLEQLTGEWIFNNALGDMVVVVMRDGKLLFADARIKGEPIPLEPDDATPPATKATPEGFRKVLKGMTERQVVARIGPPDQSNIYPGQNIGGGWTPTVKMLSWGDAPGDMYSLTLQNGRVTTGSARVDGKRVDLSSDDLYPRPNSKPNAAPKPKPRLDPAVAEAFPKVQKGMTEEQVVALLGRPTNTMSFPARETGPLKGSAWEILRWDLSEKDLITVEFEDEKVVSASSHINGKVVDLKRDIPKPVAKPRLDQALVDGFAKVRVGMTEEQVIALLGKPESSRFIPNGEGMLKSKELMWGDLAGDNIRLELLDDKVDLGVAIIDGKLRTLAEFALPPKPNPEAPPVDAKALAKGFDKIRAGMTEKQIVALLGPPTKTAEFPARKVGTTQFPETKHLIWGQTEEDSVTVFLDDGKVKSALGRFNGKSVFMKR